VDPEGGLRGGFLLEPFFVAGAGVYHALHDAGLLPREHLQVPVWSVGNLVVGGTGKTPAVLALARAARSRGRRVAVLTRGYGGTAEGVLRNGEWVEPPVSNGVPGDEALLLSLRLSDVPVVVGRNRARGAKRLLSQEPVDLVLLDDGFQHRALGRDRDVVLLDAERPLGNGRRLPAGPLREGARALRRADLILATGGLPADPVPERIRRLAERYAPQARLRAAWTKPAGIRPLGGEAPQPAETWSGVGVLLVSAIARPGRFRRLLERSGCRVGDAVAFRDHHVFRPQEVRELERRAREGGLRLVTTAKDEVRLWRVPRQEPWWVAEIELGVQGGWEELVEGLEKPPGAPREAG